MQRGFTLIEMMVATVIVLIVMGTGITLLNGSTKAQSVSTKRIGASENTKLLFQLLARDLEGAYRGPNTPSLVKGRLIEADAYPVAGDFPIVVADAVTPATDILQLYTKSDASTVTDECVFVRYYRNHADRTLCRKVIPVLPTEAPEQTDPRETTETSDADALFDGVRQIIFVYRQWDPVTKVFLPSFSDTVESTDIPACTHLKVTIIMENLETYSKVLPLPSTF
jgi:prepilin-type N-terminal cleavage/methylation domain-containing protein